MKILKTILFYTVWITVTFGVELATYLGLRAIPWFDDVD